MKNNTPFYVFYWFFKRFSPFQISFLLFLVFTINSYSQGGTCSSIEPFCSGDQALIFANCNNQDPDCTPTAEEGPDYGCLGSEPYPAWFYLQIDQAGQLDFDIIQNTAFDADGNPIGTGLDVDFIAWGPFEIGDDLCDYSQLQSFNEIGCSYSIDYIESFSILNGQPGEVYVLLITNYSQDVGFIQLVQTNAGSSGSGSTNCDIVLTCDVEIEGGDQTFCEVTETTLTTSTSGPVQSYQWYFNDTLITGATNDNLTVSESGAYKVIVDGVECDQAVEDEVNITIPGLISVNLGEDQIFCDVDSFEIIPNIEGDATNATYLWNTGETSPTIVVTETGDYNVIVTAETCSVTDSISFIFDNTPLIELGDDIEIESCFDVVEILDASPSNMDPTTVTYLWSTGETTSTISVSEGGIYSVVVSTENCSSEDSITINIIERSDLDISLIDDFKSCIGEEWTITSTTGEEGITYQWLLNSDVLSGETSSSIDIVIDEEVTGTQTYTVIITKGNCTGTDEMDISLYDVGNCIITQGISPNGSPGFNDNLDLEFLNDRTGISKLQLFNRYGTLVYEKNNYINEWFGQDKNDNELPTGTYYYVLDLLGEDSVYGAQPTGWIYLNRDAN